MAKNFLLKTIAGIFIVSIFGMAVVTAVNSVFSRPDKLKAALTEGKVYEAVADGIVTDAVKRAEKDSELPLKNKTVQNAARAAVTPDLIKENGEKVIDGTYSWLEGETPTPEFSLNTQDIKDQVGNNVADAGMNRVKGLPVCTYAQLQQINTSDIDPFTLPCQPPGLNLTKLRSQYAKEIAKSDEFLKDSAVTAQDVKSADGQNVFATAEAVPKAFQLGQKLPWIFGILAILSGVGVFFLNKPHNQGLKTLGLSLLSAGVLLLLAMFATSFFLGQIKPEVAADSVAIQDAAISVIKSLTTAINRPMMMFAIFYAALGAAGLVGNRFLSAQTAASTGKKMPVQKADTLPKK